MFKRAFTIVELLIVIVVIGILAAVIIVSYTGITSSATAAALQEDLSRASKSLEAYKVQNSDTYPASWSIAQANGVAGGSGTMFYVPNGKTYCLQEMNGGQVYSVTNFNPTPLKDYCSHNGLVTQYRLNGTAINEMNNGHNGLATSITYGTGQNGSSNGAAVFNGTSSYIDLDNSSAFNAPEATLSAWVNPSTITNSINMDIFAHEKTYKMTIKPSGAGLNIYASTDGNTWTNVFGPNYSFAIGNWYYIVMTVSSINGIVAAYINGSLVGSASMAPITKYNGSVTVIGAYVSGSSRAELFNGLIDDVRFYNRALGATQIANLYTAGAN